MGKQRTTATLVLLLAAFCLPTAPARADFDIAVEGFAGNYLVGIQSHLVDDNQGLLETARLMRGVNLDQGFSLIYADDADPGIRFRFEFGAPNNQPLVVGVFANAEGSYSYDPTAPFLEVSALSNSCGDGYGEYNVKEVVESADRSSLLQFAADLTYYCEGNAAPVRASIRLNSAIPLWDGGPDTIAGDDQIVAPADFVQLDGSASASIDGSPLSYQWTQTSGTPVVLDDATAAGPTFSAPGPIAREYQYLEFQLESTDTSMRSSSDIVIVTVTEAPEQQTLFNSDFEEGTFYQPARVINGPLDPESIGFSYWYPSNIGLSYSVEPGDPVPERENFVISLYASYPHRIGEGIYYGASRELDGSWFARVRFGENHLRCADPRGDFIVREAVFEANGIIERLAVDFDHRCPEGWDGEMNGVLRFNSAVPITSRAPTAAPGPHRVAFSGDVINLDARASSGGDTPIATHTWQQTAGQVVSLSGDDQAVASFVAPVVAAGVGGMVFDLTVTNDAGYSDTGTVDVTVLGPDDPKNYARLFADPDAYDFIMWGEDRYFDDNNTVFSMGRDNLATREYSKIELLTTGGNWVIGLAPILGQELAPGIYREFSTDPSVNTRPYFQFTGDGKGCTDVVGEFIIHEVEQQVDGTIERLALDLTHTCTTLPPDRTTTGVIRYNSTIPDAAPDPIAEIFGDPTVITGTEVTLDSSGSYPGSGNITTIEWAQIGGPAVTITDSNAPSISFTPEFAGSGPILLQFQVTITSNDGRISTSTYTVTVIPDGVPFSAIAVESEPGDFIGRGRTIYLDVDDVEFSRGSHLPYMAYVEANGVESWNFRFASADGAPLTPGNYEFALRSVQGFPAMGVSANGRGCNTLFGRFVVHEITWQPDDTLDSLAIDFVQDCDYRGPVSRGSLRYNSTVPLKPPVPNAAAGRDLIQAERNTVQLDGSNSHDADGQIVGYAWSQISGPAVTLDDAASAAPSFIAPDVSQNNAVIEFELTVLDDNGNTDTDVVAVTILDDLTPRNQLYMHLKEPGFTFAVGDISFSDNNAIFSESLFPYTQELTVSIDTFWRYGLMLRGPNDTLIEEGLRYDYAREYRNGDGAHMNAILEGTLLGGEGWFDVLELQMSGDELVTLAADFKHQVVDYVPPIVGSLRYNSATPTRTSFVGAYAESTSIAVEGSSVVLNGLDSYATESDIVRHEWRVVEGPMAAFSIEAGTPSFVVPAIAMSESPLELVIELEVEDDFGTIDTDQLVIDIYDNGVSDFPEDILTIKASGKLPLAVSVDDGDLVFNEVINVATSGGDSEAEPDVSPEYGVWFLRVLAPSGSAMLNLHAPDPGFDEDIRWTSNTEASGWQLFQGDQSLSADRTTLQLVLVDGGDDDLDGVVNGTVEIRGAPGVFRPEVDPPPPSPATPQPSGGGGSTAPLSFLLLILVSLWSRNTGRRSQTNFTAKR